jgi:phage terminase small subunit
MESKLTDRQDRFCLEYIIDLNATQAAIRAGYAENSAMEQGHQLLQKTSVLERIKDLKESRSKRTQITADRVIRELAKIGFANIQDYIKTGNEAKDFSKISRRHAAVISSIKVTEIAGADFSKTTTEFKLHDKLSALEKIGRHLGIYEKDNQQKVQDIKTWVYQAASELEKGKKGE